MGETTVRKSWAVRSELGQEKIVVSGVERALRDSNLALARAEEIVTAVTEACLNAIEHGNRFASELPVRVTMAFRPGRCTFRVFDGGAGMELAPQPVFLTVQEKIGWKEPRGWGLQLMRQYADEVRTYRRRGKFCVELHFQIDGDGQGESAT